MILHYYVECSLVRARSQFAIGIISDTVQAAPQQEADITNFMLAGNYFKTYQILLSIPISLNIIYIIRNHFLACFNFYLKFNNIMFIMPHWSQFHIIQSFWGEVIILAHIQVNQAHLLL